MKNIRSITIDLDGTLLDTAPDLGAAANAMLIELGYKPYPLATITEFVGLGIPNLVARCLPDLDDIARTNAMAIFRRHYAIENGRQSRLYDGVLDALAAFRQAGLPMAVVTNKASAFTDPLLQITNLAAWFAFAISGDTLAQKKPHPQQLLYACERFGTLPHENLHLGDSATDAAAARAAGCPVLLVSYGYDAGVPVQDVDCDGIVGSLLDAARRVI
ncbi:MAG: phosphoglycolate phosphatase [Rhodocyclaceae bacterium]|nr:phosphoglycolate phosphatase [Rhodocyclaceae bacterium]MBP6109977.1 phosphoglycolate phosphatase [Rhodocyclaceae bacterium]